MPTPIPPTAPHSSSSVILKMEAIRSSETSVHTIFTRLHIPEEGIILSSVIV
jgi:hypothetical protein